MPLTGFGDASGFALVSDFAIESNGLGGAKHASGAESRTRPNSGSTRSRRASS